MAEPDKRQIGDGSDNYGEAAKQMAKAAKEAGIETAKQGGCRDSRRNRCGRTVGRNFIGGMGHASYTV